MPVHAARGVSALTTFGQIGRHGAGRFKTRCGRLACLFVCRLLAYSVMPHQRQIAAVGCAGRWIESRRAGAVPNSPCRGQRPPVQLTMRVGIGTRWQDAPWGRGTQREQTLSTYEVVTDIAEIARLNKVLGQQLLGRFRFKTTREITYPSNHHTGTVFFESASGTSVRAWSPNTEPNKLMNFMLAGDPEATDWMQIDVHLNFPAGTYNVSG